MMHRFKRQSRHLGVTLFLIQVGKIVIRHDHCKNRFAGFAWLYKRLLGKHSRVFIFQPRCLIVAVQKLLITLGDMLFPVFHSALACDKRGLRRNKT